MLTGHEIEMLRRQRLDDLARKEGWPRFDGELVVCLGWGVLFLMITVGASLGSLVA